MAIKKGIRPAGKRKRGLSILLILAFGTLTIFALVLYLYHSITNISPPQFEEIYSKTSNLNQEIGKIDKVIYAALYYFQVPETNIIFSEVRPEEKEGYQWEFTRQSIEQPNIDLSSQLRKRLESDLSQLSPVVSYDVKKASENELCFHIFALGFPTHELTLKAGSARKVLDKKLARIAIIIDDLGYDRDMALSFMQMDMKLNFSVLPLAAHTKEIVDEVNKRGYELILHLPMEPRKYPSINPGAGALLTTMDENEIRKMLNQHLNAISGLRGVNNHMGSLFTERPDKMNVVLSELKRHKLFYLDSRTTNRSVAEELARKMGISTGRRNVFLDNELSERAIRLQMERLFGLARNSGGAIGIGHPNKMTLKILKDYLPMIKAEFEVVSVASLMSRIE